MQEILADVQRTDTLDQASRDRLLLDLRESDRSLWPLLVQQFRAELRQQPAGDDPGGTAGTLPRDDARRHRRPFIGQEGEFVALMAATMALASPV